ncbi:MAG: type II toxin-antitoxin system HicA family toxin [Actinomycetota bacterium]|nr:type II toxin-antitoxin system HicA family toxin [Actinomycetota bacterium]
MNSEALLRRLARGDVANVRFSDLRRLLGDLGFEHVRLSGSHEIYAHPSVTELVNLQEVKGQAKPYQLRQLVRLIERYDLRLEDR